MRVTTYGQLMELLDSLYADGAERTSDAAAAFWDGLFQREGHPLTSELPDAALPAWQAEGLLPRGHGASALDVGCGLGRNSTWLAAQGFTVTGIDISPYAVETARSRTARSGDAASGASGSGPDYGLVDFVREPVAGGPFDFVYDSGCFHHLAPHRRISYMEALSTALASGGVYGICTFTAGEMGSTASDKDLLLQGHLEGGVGYTLDELAEMFAWLELVDARLMPPGHTHEEPTFSHDFLQVALFRRPSTSS